MYKRPSRKLFIEKLITWGRENRRDFPWRKEKDAFRILVAEVLLQRSRAKTVTIIYTRLFKRWPDSKCLASADISRLEKIISPLGLTSRAATIIELAQVIEKQGGVPHTTKELMSLPGVGRYIASATAASAYDLPEPLVDGVTARVYSRFFGLSLNTDKKINTQKLNNDVWNFVEGITYKNMTELNWAALDLAATVCMPKKPRHGLCPLNRWCLYSRSEKECEL